MRTWRRSFQWTAFVAVTLGAALVLAQDSHRSDSLVMQGGAHTQLLIPTEAVVGNPDNGSGPAPSAWAELPDGPDAALPGTPQESNSAQSMNQPKPQSFPEPPAERKLERPVGTAAAPASRLSGVAATQPTGVAIAPAKQKRVRTVVIKVGAILSAGAALGIGIALAEATPSKPPGAH